MPAKTCIFNQETHSMAVISQDAIKLGCLGGQGKIQIQPVLQLSRIFYKSAYFYAKQSQFSKKSNGCKINHNKGI
jgi:hypothetical protein